MRLDTIDVFHVAMPLIAPWKTAFSEETAIDTILVRITGEGHVGWGEASPYAMPQFCPEWATGCFFLIRDVFAPRLAGRDFETGADLQAALASFKGNQFAKAAIDLAFWDLLARSRGEPLWRMIGGVAPQIAVGADISVQDDRKTLVDGVGASLAAGYSRVKLKFRRDSGAGMVAAVREAYPDAALHIDCNGAFTLDDTPLFRELDTMGLTMIEQPLATDDLVDHARLQEQLATPICLDESITSVHRAEKAIAIGAARWINIKHGRVGGLTNALALNDLCRKCAIPSWIGSMLESNVGQGPSLALATLPDIAYAADVFPDGRLYAQDICEPAIHLSGPGTVTVPDSPGHGYAPVPERLARHLVRATTA